MKKFKSYFLFAALLVAMLLPLGQISKVYASYTPSNKYVKFIPQFKVDRTWSVNANGSGTMVTHGGLIAWRLETWNDRDANTDDYSLDTLTLYLTNKDHSKQIPIVHIKIKCEDCNYPSVIDNFSDCRTWSICGERGGAWSGADGESYYICMITEYSNEVENFINTYNDGLSLRAKARWDNKSWAVYDEYSLLDEADRTLLERPAEPVVSSIGWVVNDTKTAVKYTYSIGPSCQIGLQGFLYSGMAFDYAYRNVTAGNHTEFLYPFTYSKTPTSADLVDGREHYYYFRARKAYTTLTDNYVYHGSGTSTCPETHYLYSEAVKYSAPMFPQPQNARATDKGNGTVELTWTVDEKSSGSRDNSNFIIERSYDSNFLDVTKIKTVNYEAGKTSYSFTDEFSDRNEGDKTFYYRIHRENACVGELNATCKQKVNTDYKKVCNLNAEPTGDGHIRLSWELSSGIWISNNKNDMRLRIKYTNGLTTSVLTEIPNGNTTTYTTNQQLETCTPLDFSIEVLSNGVTQSSAKTEESISLPNDLEGKINAVNPSEGYYNDRVIIQWTTDEDKNNFNYFVVKRQEYNTSNPSEILGTVNYVLGLNTYSFEDRDCVPGVYYTYYILGYATCNDSVQMQYQMSEIGFAQPYGVVSGQITYNGKQGVSNVYVSAIGEGVNCGHSLHFNMENNPQILIAKDMLSQMLGTNAGTVEFYQKREGETEFRHIAVTYQGSTYTTYINGVPQAGTDRPAWFPVRGQDWDLAVYDDAGQKVNGFIDEIRVWNVYRDSIAIAKTKNCYLNGQEEGLTAYYRCDDNVDNRLFDISQTANTFNSRHLVTRNVILDEFNIPSTEQLSLRAYTDNRGNYLINNVPFTAGGSLYEIIPMLGIHSFAPTSRPLFFNSDAMTHNSINFTDVSSFPVSGQVLYEGTNYPVANCTFTVDGTMCFMDDKPVLTDENGMFTIMVPIGAHYISVEKEGHTFLYGGRYPEAKEGASSTFDFQEEMNGLMFYDNTLVPLTGRVAGGQLQAELPHGFQQGKANIGQATVVISPKTKDKYSLNITGTDRKWEVPEGYIVRSSAVTPSNDMGTNRFRITITTDSMTGEFAAMLPPIDMTVDDVQIPSDPSITFDLGSINEIKLNRPDTLEWRKDKFVINDDTVSLSYAAVLDIIHRVSPKMDIADINNGYGMFGIENYYVSDNALDTVYTINIYEKDTQTGEYKYNYGVPYFNQAEVYAFRLHAFELYTNKDDVANLVCDSVPVRGSIVTIANELGLPVVDRDSVELKVLEENQVQLDSLGYATYIFVANEPNFSGDHCLGMTVTYTDESGNTNYDWEHNNDFKAIVLGMKMDGSNFVTAGPDKIRYVLRDPPGSGSYAILKKGSSFVTTDAHTEAGQWNGMAKLNVKWKTKITVSKGGLTMGLLSEVVERARSVGGLAKYSGNSSITNTTTTTYMITEDISTSSRKEYVGSAGDVYIGESTNLIFGEATELTFVRDAQGNFNLTSQPAIAITDSVTTAFQFTQSDIKTAQIPNLLKMRNDLLTTVTPSEYADENYPNYSDEPIYITTLSSTDKDFGKEGTYRFITPNNVIGDFVGFQDMVEYYNDQVTSWIYWLTENERAKVKSALAEGKNISVDGGVTYTTSATLKTADSKQHKLTNGFTVSLFGAREIVIRGKGGDLNFKGGGGYNHTDMTNKTSDSTQTVAYTINPIPYEQLSINVYQDTVMNGSPIFSTLGGQTYCPYEGEEKTQYYEPGKHVLHNATQKIEDPYIRIDGSSNYSAIPVGGEAVYNLQLANQTPTGLPMTMMLRLMDNSNPNGAVLTVEGMPLTVDGVKIHFMGNTPISKTLVLRQGRPDKLEYKNIGIILSSECMPYKTADTCYISATFVAACSDIDLTTNTRVVNKERNGQLILTISGYNTSLSTLTGCRVQYKQPFESNWHLMDNGEFTKEDMKEGLIVYPWDMSLFNDGEYEVRAVTVCNLGGQEVSNESEVISIIKDMTAPEPLGVASPINGIYTADNQIYVDFNEPIQTGKVISSCVEVKGLLNAHELSHTVALQLDKNSAYTQAEYDFSNTNFAIEMWLNWTESGELFMHGKEGLVCAIDEAGHLQIRYAGNKWTSTNTLPKDKWCYLAISYHKGNDQTGFINAHAAYDATTVNLFDNSSIPVYTCRGRIDFGSNNIKAAIHDVTIWDIDREWMTAISERNSSKDAYTMGLISYWPMDEGYGVVAVDHIRYRNLTLADGSVWWFNNTNKALHIPAATEAVVDMYKYPTFFNDDYMFGFWFRSEATGKTTLFQVNDSVAGYIDGNVFEWQLGGKSYRTVTGIALNNGAWHHLAMNSSHSFSPMVFIDGEQCNVPVIERMHIVSPQLLFSSIASTDALEIDEIQMWKATISPTFISKLFRSQHSGYEQGLLAYYPMDKTVVDQYGQNVTEFTLSDQQHRDSVPATDIYLRNSLGDVEAKEATIVPPVRQARNWEEVKHTFTVSDTRLMVNITEETRRIEGCPLIITVKDIVDMNGNYAAPVNWYVFVNRNQLLWEQDQVSISKAAMTDTTVTMVIRNAGSRPESWSVTNIPDWLSVSETAGVLAPLSSKTLSFTVLPELGIGTHEQTLYLKGNENINQALHLTVKVNANRPNWVVNPADYEYSMNMVALATINGHMADDSEDEVAAFINGKLAGVGSPKLFPAYNTYLIMMDVYANLNDKQRDSINHGVKIHLPVTFKYWDASTGIIYNRMGIQLSLLDTPKTYMDYLPGQMIGMPSNPVLLTSDKYIEQTISLTTGWNWISFNVLPDNNAFTAILNDVLDSLSLIKSQTTFAQLDEMRHLVGSLDYMEAIKAYKCRMSQPCDLTVSGEIPNPAYLGIPLTANGWSWVGYLPQTTLSVDAALANLNPSMGDIIKARSGFATWDGYKWVGSLTAMAPGNGYLYYNSTAVDALLYYPSAGLSLLTPANLAAKRSSAQQYSISTFSPIDPTTYQGNMTMTAVVKNGEQIVTDAEVGIFAGEECRAAAVEHDGYWFITIPGESNVELTIKVAVGGEVKTVKQSLVYVDDAMIGSPTEPYVIQLDETSDLLEIGEWSNLNVQKAIHDGILYIKRNSKIYTAQGQLIK